MEMAGDFQSIPVTMVTHSDSCLSAHRGLRVLPKEQLTHVCVRYQCQLPALISYK